MRAVVEGEVARNERSRLRLERLHVRLEPQLDVELRAQLARGADLFEDYCIVTESVRAGIDVQVEVATLEVLPDGAAAY